MGREPYTSKDVRTVREGAWMKPQVKASMAQLCLPHDRYHNEGHPIAFKEAYFEYSKNNFFTDNQIYWKDYFLDKVLTNNVPEYIKQAAKIVDYANLEKEEKELIDLVEKFEAEQRAREEWVRDDVRIKAIKNFMNLGMPIEEIASAFDMTIEQINELLNDMYH